MIIPGTTPIHEFELPIDTALLKEVKVIYAQNDEMIFCKRAKDCSLNGNVIRIKLTQEDTFLVDCNKMVQVWIRALTHNGDSLAMEDPITITAKKCFDSDKEVLS